MCYKMVQLRFLGLRPPLELLELSEELFPLGELEPTKARAAASKTGFNPCCVKAEHSLNDVALISFCNARPCSLVMGAWSFLLNSSITFGSVLKSYFVPTKTMGVSGQ